MTGAFASSPAARTVKSWGSPGPAPTSHTFPRRTARTPSSVQLMRSSPPRTRTPDRFHNERSVARQTRSRSHGARYIAETLAFIDDHVVVARLRARRVLVGMRAVGREGYRIARGEFVGFAPHLHPKLAAQDDDDLVGSRGVSVGNVRR